MSTQLFLGLAAILIETFGLGVALRMTYRSMTPKSSTFGLTIVFVMCAVSWPVLLGWQLTGYLGKEGGPRE